MTKSKAQQLATKRRAFEQFGLHLTNTDLGEIVRMIQAGDGILIEVRSKRLTVWEVQLPLPCNLATALTLDPEPALVYPAVKTFILRVVYDKQRKTVVSVKERINT
jgi:hypothetical protein